jgi:hypothetical protein
VSQRGDIALQIRWAETMVSLHVENVAYYPDVLNDMGKQAGAMFKQALSDISDYVLTTDEDDEEFESESEEVEEASD